MSPFRALAYRFLAAFLVYSLACTACGVIAASAWHGHVQ